VTLLVGIWCTDGAIIAADQAFTFGGPSQVPTIAHRGQKIEIINDQVIIAGTGSAGLAQRFTDTIGKAWRNNKLSTTDAMDVARQMATFAISDFRGTGAPMNFGALVAFPKKKDAYLVEFTTGDLQPEMKSANTWYVSMGSGQSLADPYLGFIRHVLWKDGPPDVRQGLFAASWVMQQSLLVAPGYIGPPIDIAVLQNNKAKILSKDEVEEHLERVAAANEHFRQFFDKEEAPPVPTAPLPGKSPA
jgi:20S proteasome alpha/beta subunit